MKKLSIRICMALTITAGSVPNAYAEDAVGGITAPTGIITIDTNSYGEQFRVTVVGQFVDLPDGQAFTLCLIGKDPSLPKFDSKECYGFIHHTDRAFSRTFNLPQKYQLEASAGLFGSLKFNSTQTSSVIFATSFNDVFVCQLKKTCKTPKPSPVASSPSTSSSSISRYSDGYKLINQPPSTLKALGFYGYFSANKKMTKSNAKRFCDYFVRQSSLRSDYFDGFSSKEMTTFLEGCMAAALKIPYGK